ncbi:MAG: hypothetical protein HYW86_03805 [Candidatus Roizmanbacteria bacterium]|nr:MAG: hypothetical protein HYW86_03805 [Candidatus Roizmanbacteria bacterium]
MSIILYDVVIVFRRAHGFCECNKSDHYHQDRCQNPVLWRSRGLKSHKGILFGSWQISYKIQPEEGGHNSIKNMQILCSQCDRELRKYSLRFKQK